MNNKTVSICDRIIEYSIYLLIFAIPLFFLPLTRGILEFNKQAVLLFLTMIALVAWLGKVLYKGKVEFSKSFLSIPIAIFLIIYSLATIFSQYRYGSLVGMQGREGLSLLSIISFILVYFIIVNNFRKKQVLNSVWLILISTGFAAIFGVFQMFGKFIFPWLETQAGSFNSIGTLNALGIFLALSLSLVACLLITRGKSILKIFLVILGAFILFALLLVNYWGVWIGLMVSMGLILAFAITQIKKLDFRRLVFPMIILILVVLFYFSKVSPITLNVPAEVMPSIGASWNIDKATLQEKPLLGSGPGTFAFDYAEFKSPDLNETDFWNVRFNKAFSQVLTMIATLGILGILSWLFLIGSYIYIAICKLTSPITSEADQEIGVDTRILSLGLFSSWILLPILGFLYSTNLTLSFFFFVLMALFIANYEQKASASLPDEAPSGAKAGAKASASADSRRPKPMASDEASADKAAGKGGINFFKGLSLKSKTMGILKKKENKFPERSDGGMEASGTEDVSPQRRNDVVSASNDVSSKKTLILSFVFILVIILAVSVSYLEAQRYAGAIYYKKGVRAAQDIDNLEESISYLVKASNLDRYQDVYLRDLAQTFLLNIVQEASKEPTEERSDRIQVLISNAISSARQATDLSASDSQNWVGLAATYQEIIPFIQGAGDWATKSWEKALELEPNNPFLYTQLGRVYLSMAMGAEEAEQAQYINKAIQNFNKALDSKENYNPAHFQLALTYEQQGDLDKAIEKMESNKRFLSQDMGVAYELGRMYLLKGDKEKAKTELERAISLNDRYSNARWFLSLIYEDEGETDKAVEQVEKIAVLNPDSELVRNRLENLRAGEKGTEALPELKGEFPAIPEERPEEPEE